MLGTEGCFFILFNILRDLAQFISWNCTVQVIQHIVMRPEDRGSSVLAEKRCRFSMQLKLGRLHIFGIENFFGLRFIGKDSAGQVEKGFRPRPHM